MTRAARSLLRPQRPRTIERPFAWIPCRLLTDGLLADINRPGKLLYLFLAIAADRHGLSFYSDRRILETLGIDSAELQLGRTQLAEMDLLAFDGQTYQLLSLPTRSPNPTPPPPTTSASPQPISSTSTTVSLPEQPYVTEIPAQCRRILRKSLGCDFND